jgi:hypothetical protein
MPDYSKSKIYRLDCGDLIYIGSTTETLCVRKAKHKNKYLRDGDCSSKSIYKYADDNGLDLVKDIRIELLEFCPCNNIEELLAIEGKYIRQYKSEYGEKCVNRCIAGRSKKEYKKEWTEKNKDKIVERNKQYRNDNKDKIAERRKLKYKDKMKAYQLKNKDKIAEQKRQYYLFKKIDKIFGLYSIDV